MAALFLLAVTLIVWQALRTKPVLQPAFEIATEAGERVSPVAVPSWRPRLEPPRQLPDRLAFLEDRALSWPSTEKTPNPDCKTFVRISSQHWALHPAPSIRVERWERFYFPAASFLDDDDGDGDPLDRGELRASGPGAEVEVFCGQAAQSAGDRR